MQALFFILEVLFLKKANEEIRAAARENGVYLWEIADALGLADSNFSRLLRHELPENTKISILAIIGAVAEGREVNQCAKKNT